MRYKDLISEGARLIQTNIDMRNFYANMELLLKSKDREMPSSLEGIDAVARLGFLGNSTDSILKSIGVRLPTQYIGSRGSFDYGKDEINFPFDRIFKRGGVRTTSTALHELRHRAFHYISKTPEIVKLMPPELQQGGKWADGYGVFWQSARTKYRITDGDDDEIDASPEHAMIYAVQYKNVEDRKLGRDAFINNKALGNLGADYWRDLYMQVNDACKQFLINNFEGKYKDDMYPKLAQGQTPLIKDRSSIATMSPTMAKYWAAWSKIGEGARIYIQIVSKEMQTNVRERLIKYLELKRDGRYDDASEKTIEYWETAVKIYNIWNNARTMDYNQIDPTHDYMETPLLVKEYWDVLDIRNYTSKQVQTIVNTPKTTTQAKPKQITFVEFANKTAYIQGKRETAMQHVISMIGKPLFEGAIEHVVFLASTAKTRGWDHNYTMDKDSKSQLELAVSVSNNYKPKDRDPKDLVMNFLSRAKFTQKP